VTAILSVDSVVRRGGQIVFAALDDEVLAIDADQGLLYSLNETGRRVWEAITEPATVRDLCARLAASYDVDEGTCQRDVIALLGSLRDAGLIEVVSAEQSSIGIVTGGIDGP
jgi:hypothetical protein